jgi:hypothetical protein
MFLIALNTTYNGRGIIQQMSPSSMPQAWESSHGTPSINPEATAISDSVLPSLRLPSTSEPHLPHNCIKKTPCASVHRGVED